MAWARWHSACRPRPKRRLRVRSGINSATCTCRYGDGHCCLIGTVSSVASNVRCRTCGCNDPISRGKGLIRDGPAESLRASSDKPNSAALQHLVLLARLVVLHGVQQAVFLGETAQIPKGPVQVPMQLDTLRPLLAQLPLEDFPFCECRSHVPFSCATDALFHSLIQVRLAPNQQNNTILIFGITLMGAVLAHRAPSKIATDKPCQKCPV